MSLIFSHMKAGLIESESRVRPGGERINLPGSYPGLQTLCKHVCKRADESTFVSETHKTETRYIKGHTWERTFAFLSASGASFLLPDPELQVCVSRLFERSISGESHLSVGSR